MPDDDPRGIRQFLDAGERTIQRIVVTAEDPAASHHEEHVTSDEQVIRIEVIDDMIGAMTGRLPDSGGHFSDTDGVTLTHDGIGCFGHISGGGRGDHPATETVPDRFQSLNVIPVAVGHEAIGQFPPGIGQRLHDGRLVRRIDGGTGAAFGIADQRRRHCLPDSERDGSAGPWRPPVCFVQPRSLAQPRRRVQWCDGD